MKLTIHQYVTLMTASLALVLFLSKQESCSKTKQPTAQVTERIVYDTVIRTIPLHSVQIILKDSLVYRDTSQKVDTIAILNKFARVYFYQQQLRDSLLEAQISDSVYQNKIIARSFSYRILKPVQIIVQQSIAQKPHAQIYCGAALSASENVLVVHPMLSVLHQNRIYSISTNLLTTQPNIGVGVQFSLFNK